MGAKKTEELLTNEEVMHLFKVSKDFLESARASYGLPFFKIGKFVRYRASEVEKWLKERKHNA